MTKKDYELIADVISHTYILYMTPEQVVWEISMNFADVLAEENPRFNRQKFLEACDVNEARPPATKAV